MTTFKVDPEALVLVQRNWTVYHVKWAEVEAGKLDDEDLVLIQREDQIYHMRIGDYRDGSMVLGELDFVWANLETRDRNEFVPSWKHFHFPWSSVRGLEFTLGAEADLQNSFIEALSIRVEGARANWDGIGPYLLYPDGTKEDITSTTWSISIRAKDPVSGAPNYQDGKYLLVGQFELARFMNSGALTNIKISEEIWNMMFWWAPGTQVDGIQNHTFRANSLGKEMFKSCKNFQGNTDPNGWNNLRFRNFERMFQSNYVLDQNVSGMIPPPDRNKAVAMFLEAKNFNNGGEPLTLDMQSCEEMTYMFQKCDKFNADITAWDVSKCKDMKQMFYLCKVFNQNIGGWDVKNVTTMSESLRECPSFDQNLGAWDVSNVTNMGGMFAYSGANGFNNGGSDSIKHWDTGKVDNFEYMFSETPFNHPIGSWDTSGHINHDTFYDMFAYCSDFDQDLTGWCVDRVTQVPENFALLCPIEGDLTKLPVWGTCP